MAKKSLTTREVAQLIGVGEATVKRWAEKSVLHSERTLGGHRRFRLEDVARFQRASSLGGRRRADGRLRIAAASEQVDGASPGTTSLAVFRALVAGQEHEVAALLIGAHLTGASLGAVFDDVLCAAMRRVGDLWYAGDLSVDQEHLATRTALNAINLLKVIIDLPESSTHRAICCCVEEDFHELPVHLTQLILESNDWKVLNLGGNTPFFALAEALARHSPELVCVSAAVLNNPDRAAREYQGLRAAAMRSGATILLGGQVFGGERIRSRFPADYYGDSFRDLANLLGQWSATHCADAVS